MILKVKNNFVYLVSLKNDNSQGGKKTLGGAGAKGKGGKGKNAKG